MLPGVDYEKSIGRLVVGTRVLAMYELQSATELIKFPLPFQSCSLLSE